MGRLIYALNVSLDGFVETPDRSLDWAIVDEELHTWFNDRARELDASIYGRRMYQLMTDYWPTVDSDPSATDAMREFGRIWSALPRVVFSTTLDSVDPNSRLVRGDVGEELAGLRTVFPGDMDLGGARLASEFVRRGLVDEYQLLVHPVVIGAGTPYFPQLETPLRLRLLEERSFSSGVTLLRYEPVGR
ncbi:MAG TPA: dihydrofolate reductase family protein [Candidatus Limnocylindrales bacterium]|jgi:dihydrofolate reductase